MRPCVGCEPHHTLRSRFPPPFLSEMMQSLLRSPLGVSAPCAVPASRGSLVVVASTRPQWKVRGGRRQEGKWRGSRAGGALPSPPFLGARGVPWRAERSALRVTSGMPGRPVRGWWWAPQEQRLAPATRKKKRRGAAAAAAGLTLSFRRGPAFSGLVPLSSGHEHHGRRCMLRLHCVHSPIKGRALNRRARRKRAPPLPMRP